MMTMRRKTTLRVLIIGVMLLFIPITAFADAVPWISQSYHAYAAAGEDLQSWCIGLDMCDIQESYGSPLPISASASYDWPEYPNSAYSEITASRMYLEAMVTGIQKVRAYASASFIGNFTSEDNYFMFSYDGSLGWLTVKDVTTSTTLFDVSGGGTGAYYIPTPVGDEIEVNFGLWKGEIIRASESGSRSLTYGMSTSTAVAPEPISSILFVTGGTLLVGRRFLRKKA